ncbi:MAG: hypothetical protein WBD50_03140 [Candidatus Rhabdochlamydia sp.]
MQTPQETGPESAICKADAVRRAIAGNATRLTLRINWFGLGRKLVSLTPLSAQSIALICVIGNSLG